MRRQSAGQELLISVAIILVIAVVNLTSGRMLGAMSNTFVSGALNKLLLSILAMAGAIILKRTWILRSDPALLKKNWLCALPEMIFWVLQVFVIVASKTAVSVGAFSVILFLLQMFFVGFNEEVQFRGILLNSFYRLFGEDSVGHVVLATLCGGACFGAVHLLNAVKPEISLGSAALQALGACAAGVFYGAIYFRTGKCLWYLIAVHAIHDALIFVMSGRLSGMGTEAAIDQLARNNSVWTFVAQSLFFLLVGLFLLRRKKVEPLLEDRNANCA